MQIRAEEQDDEDKQGIALMGRKEGSQGTEAAEVQPDVPTDASAKRSFLPKHDFPQPVGTTGQIR